MQGRLFKEGVRYTLHDMETKELELKLEDIPIVNEFLDVLLNNLLGLPSDREIKFKINLILRTAPILKAPY